MPHRALQALPLSKVLNAVLGYLQAPSQAATYTLRERGRVRLSVSMCGVCG